MKRFCVFLLVLPTARVQKTAVACLRFAFVSVSVGAVFDVNFYSSDFILFWAVGWCPSLQRVPAVNVFVSVIIRVINLKTNI